MGLFDIIYSNLPATILPVRLRRVIHKAWLKALIAGSVGALYIRFRANRANNLYILAHNGQVCYLEAALNDMFDNVNRLIYISDPPYRDPIYLYRNVEHKQVYVATNGEAGTTVYPSPVYLFTYSEIAFSISGFIVNVPAALVYDVDRLKALVNKYRLPSKTNWIISTF